MHLPTMALILLPPGLLTRTPASGFPSRHILPNRWLRLRLGPMAMWPVRSRRGSRLLSPCRQPDGIIPFCATKSYPSTQRKPPNGGFAFCRMVFKSCLRNNNFLREKRTDLLDLLLGGKFTVLCHQFGAFFRTELDEKEAKAGVVVHRIGCGQCHGRG